VFFFDALTGTNMNFNADYIPLALRTESVIAPITFNKDALDSVTDLAISVGNLADMIKKNVAYNRPTDPELWTTTLENIVQVTTIVSRIDITEVSPPSPLNTRIFHGIFGIFTEATELMEAFQYASIGNQELDYVNIQEEIGDISWYEAILLDEMGADFDAINQRVINKLKARYPDKFTSANAINRDLVTERAILEDKQ
jgi:NTP pyrophosphatase (non-canonical NTP hydrolase)